MRVSPEKAAEYRARGFVACPGCGTYGLSKDPRTCAVCNDPEWSPRARRERERDERRTA